MREMDTRHRKGRWYLPGRLYDMAFSGMFRGLRKRVIAAVEDGGLYPWLDVCCGTGSQFRVVRPSGPAFGLEGNERPVVGLDKNYRIIRYAGARAQGVPFVCGDAARLPFKDGSMRAVSVSFGLHDKSAELRRALMVEARRVLSPSGRLISVDFEKPWNAKSKLAALFVRAIEMTAGGEHYRNGRDFLERGGLKTFLRESGFAEVSRSDVAMGSLSIVLAFPI
jgi:ubiquinone/menaquinone biosynthesis C-methylase UbiE